MRSKLFRYSVRFAIPTLLISTALGTYAAGGPSGTAQSISARAEKQEQMVAACMRAAGFEYSPYVRPDVAAEVAQANGESAGRPTVDPNQARLVQMDPTIRDAWLTAEDGCYFQTEDQVWSPDLPMPAAEMAQRVEKRVDNDPGVQAARQEFFRCFEAHTGVRVRSMVEADNAGYSDGSDYRDPKFHEADNACRPALDAASNEASNAAIEGVAGE